MAKIHFLNVGHGDSTIIEHNNGNLTMIDINNGSDLDDDEAKPILESFAKKPIDYLAGVVARQYGLKSWQQILSEAGYDIELTNPIEYLKTHFPNRDIFRYIQTHPDFDHMRGLACLESSGIDILNFWNTQNTRTWREGEDKEDDKDDWNAYQRYSSGKNCTVLHLTRGANGKYWNQGDNGEFGNGLHILSPTPSLLKEYDVDRKRNEISYVLKYKTANRTIIFGGDAEQAAWEAIFKAEGNALKCDVLKASHHGRDSGYHQEAVKAMSPEVTVVSVGKKPESDATNKYRQYSKSVWSTRWWGNLTLEIDGNGKMSWTASETRYASSGGNQ
jgi:competence protein ComEC